MVYHDLDRLMVLEHATDSGVFYTNSLLPAQCQTHVLEEISPHSLLHACSSASAVGFDLLVVCTGRHWDYSMVWCIIIAVLSLRES